MHVTFFPPDAGNLFRPLFLCAATAAFSRCLPPKALQRALDWEAAISNFFSAPGATSVFPFIGWAIWRRSAEVPFFSYGAPPLSQLRSRALFLSQGSQINPYRYASFPSEAIGKFPACVTPFFFRTSTACVRDDALFEMDGFAPFLGNRPPFSLPDLSPPPSNPGGRPLLGFPA